MCLQIFLTKWGEAYGEENIAKPDIISWVSSLPWPFKQFPAPQDNPRPWILVYFTLSLTGALSVLAYIALGYYSSLKASRKLFTLLLSRLSRATIRFFDITPIGRILNRFTSDIGTVDNALTYSARAALTGCFDFLFSLLVIVTLVPRFTPFAIAIAWLYIRLAPPYVKASRDLRRLESVSLSPAFAGFDEMLKGLVHVRAFAMEQRFQEEFYRKVGYLIYQHANIKVN